MSEYQPAKVPLGADFRYGCIRSLRIDDIDGMLGWMHDPAVASKFHVDFASMRKPDVSEFIQASWTDRNSLNLAIASPRDDSYLGTVSLKHIDFDQSCAEYAIATPVSTHGTGMPFAGTRDVLALAFWGLGLHRVFLNVRTDNGRARSFYRKVGFVEEGVARQALKDSQGGFADLAWLSMLECEFKSTYPDLKE